MAIQAQCALFVTLALASPALGQDCRLALVLALDVSGSVDPMEDGLQREGLAHALLAPEVIQAFLHDEPVAVFVFEWASISYQADLTTDWQIVRSEEDLARIAAIIDTGRSPEGEARRATSGGTAIGEALVHAALALSRAPDCEARIVDVSGDGENNAGIGPEIVYENSLLDGVTVNALIIDRLRAKVLQPQQIRLVNWFQAHVLHGPGAFWIVAEGYLDYERAMKTKLLRELGTPTVSGLPVTEPRG
jgi:hypothetical protein